MHFKVFSNLNQSSSELILKTKKPALFKRVIEKPLQTKHSFLIFIVNSEDDWLSQKRSVYFQTFKENFYHNIFNN